MDRFLTPILNSVRLSLSQKSHSSGIAMNLTRLLVMFALVNLLARWGSAANLPNVMIILADDLGYSDLGCYGGEIETPNLDELANGGLRFTQFYSTARCWPTRAALLTGYYAQQVRRDTVPDLPSGSRGIRPAWARLLPEMLRPLGYRSYHSGKWHVDGNPLESGFDHSYRLDDAGRYFGPKVHWEDDRPLRAVESSAAYYSTTAIADHAIRCLREHAAESPRQPFLHYLAFTSPHFPLHAMPEDIDRYRDRYRVGWNEIRECRWQRLRQLGLIQGKLSQVERDIGPPTDHPDSLAILGPLEVNRPIPWDELTEDQRQFQATKMAIHAAMVDRMDREIGRVLAQLRAMNVFENTLIMFLSDNGASAEILVRDDGHDPAASPGSAATHFCLGPGWSNASNTPFRRHKSWVHEGGISTPLIVHWTNGIADRGELRRNPGHVIDILPTLWEIVGGRKPDQWNGQAIPPPPGKSLVPVFTRDMTVTHDYLWWYHSGNRAIRKDDWKLVSAKNGPWELFNLQEDRTETNDLAEKLPEKVLKLERAWQDRLNEFRELAARDLEASSP
jgi:arylsulfatase